MKSTKNKLLSSIATLLVCFAMLIGSTYAWFTDTASTGINRIQAGNLDVELQYKKSDTYVDAQNVTDLFALPDGSEITWEPGAVAYTNLKVVNKGTLALKYELALNVKAYTSVNDKSLLDVLKLAIVDGDSVTDRSSAISAFDTATRYSLIQGVNDNSAVSHILFGSENHLSASASSEKIYTLIVYWEPSANDNDYNMNNDKQGNVLSIDLDVQLEATQYTEENDSFGNDYDATAGISRSPYKTKKTSTQTVVQSIDTTNQVTFTAENAYPSTVKDPSKSTTVRIPAGTKLYDENNQEITTTSASGELTINTGNTLGYIAADGTNQIASIEFTLYVGTKKVKYFKDSDSNAVNVTVTTYISKGLSENPVVSYNGTGDAPTFVSYNSSTGELVFNTNHFSEYGIKGKGDIAVVSKDTVYLASATSNAIIDANGEMLTIAKDVSKEQLDVVKNEINSAKTNSQTVNVAVDPVVDSSQEESLYVAKNGYKYYLDLQWALDDAVAKDKISVLQNIAVSSAIEIRKSLTINGNHYSVRSANGDNKRVINVNENSNDINLIINDLKIVGPTSGGYTRGISVWKNTGKAYIELNNCELSANYYALNIASDNDNLKIVANNCVAIGGWSAVNVWSKNSVFEFNHCELIGINDKNYNAEGWNNFGTIVINNDGDISAENCTFAFKDCRIVAKETTGNQQRALDLRSIKSTVNLIDSTIETDGSSAIEMLDQGAKNRIYKNGELVYESPITEIWYSNDTFNTSKDGGLYVNLADPFNGNWLANGEGIILEKDVVLKNDIICQMTSGTFYLFFDNYSITGGTIKLNPDVSVISDKSGISSVFTGGTITETHNDDGTYSYKCENQ